MDKNKNISNDYNQKENVKNFDKENEPMEASVNKTETVLSKEQFKEFNTFMTIIKPYFEDFFIQDGIFRMRSDDSAIIVETEFDCFKNMNLTMPIYSPSLIKRIQPRKFIGLCDEALANSKDSEDAQKYAEEQGFSF